MKTTSTSDLKTILTERRLSHDSNQLLVEIMERWGGPAEVARALHADYAAARPGSLIRQSILDMIHRLVVNNTNHSITKLVDPSDLDTEDIDRELCALIAKAQEHIVHEEVAQATDTRPAPWDVEEPLE